MSDLDLITLRWKIEEEKQKRKKQRFALACFFALILISGFLNWILEYP